MGSRKDPDRIIPLGLSARDRVLPIWEPLYSSKAASWVGMLLERVILGVVAAVGLTMLVSWPFALKDMESAGGRQLCLVVGFWKPTDSVGVPPLLGLLLGLKLVPESFLGEGIPIPLIAVQLSGPGASTPGQLFCFFL